MALPLAGRVGLVAQTAQPLEYQLKAVFLFNFAQFVDWPPEAFPDSATPLVIEILGNDPFGSFLDATVRGETVRGRSIEVRRHRRINDITTCHILFISQSEMDRLDDILATLKDRSILTVGDIDNFEWRGGMIRFVVERNRIRFRINLEAAQAARLTISSKLLRLADTAPPRGP
jgi:hypothetical protein